MVAQLSKPGLYVDTEVFQHGPQIEGMTVFLHCLLGEPIGLFRPRREAEVLADPLGAGILGIRLEAEQMDQGFPVVRRKGISLVVVLHLVSC
ncbi:hypothetical protein D9M70_652430 [compost metagenome]